MIPHSGLINCRHENEGKAMPWVPCQVVSGGQHRRTQLGLCCSRVILRHGCQLSEVAFDVCSVCLCRHHHRGPGNAEAQGRCRRYAMPQKGSNYRMDGRLLHKHEAADGPATAWFQTSTSRIELQQKQESYQEWTRFETDASEHQRQPKE